MRSNSKFTNLTTIPHQAARSELQKVTHERGDMTVM